MIKKILLLSTLTLCTYFTLKADQTIEIPNKFYVKQHWFSLTNTFDIESKDKKFGTIHRKLFSLTPQYLFYDVNQEIHAIAKMRFFKLGATFDIFDREGLSLGKVDEKILTFFPTFDFYRADGYLAAKAKLNFWGTKYTVKDQDTEEVIAYLERSFFRFKDRWTVTIVNPNLFAEKQMDSRMFILVMAFQTDRDHWSKYRYQSSKDMEMALKTENLSFTGNSLPQAFEQYRLALEAHKEFIVMTQPTEVEIEELETMVENYLEQTAEMDEIHEERTQEKILERGISLLIPLLDSPDLSPGIKSALFLLLETQLAPY